MNQNSNTGDLFQRLQDGALTDVIYCADPFPPFPVYLAKLCEERGEAREPVIQRAGIERSYGHQLFNGLRNPSRDKAIQLAFGFGLNAEQTQELLRAATVGLLNPRIKRDAVIIYCLMHKIDLPETQRMLKHFEVMSLGG